MLFITISTWYKYYLDNREYCKQYITDILTYMHGDTVFEQTFSYFLAILYTSLFNILHTNSNIISRRLSIQIWIIWKLQYSAIFHVCNDRYLVVLYKRPHIHINTHKKDDTQTHTRARAHTHTHTQLITNTWYCVY